MAILADSINNNGIYAVRAESDKDGNRIDTTYAKKTEIPSKTSDLTNDSNFVTSSELATVATTGSYTDLSNKPDLSAYATDSELANGLATKQNVISDLDTIRAGAALGATAAQPSDLPSSDELLPSASSGDAGKILSVDSNGDPEWITPSGGDVVTANGNFKLGGSVPVKVNYTGSQEYERGSLQLVNTFSNGTYAVAVFEIVGANNIYYGTYGSATVTINEAMDIAGSGETDFAISYLNSDSDWNIQGQIYKNPAPTITDGKIVAQSLSFYSINQYLNGSYLGVGVKVTNNPNESEKIAAVVQQLANGAVSISNWPTEQILATTIPNIPASTPADANKVLTVDAHGAAVWQNVPTPSVDEVPAVTSSDDGKVLKASYSGGQGSYAWGTASGGGGGVNTVTVPDITYSTSASTIDSTLFTFNDFTVSVHGDRYSIRVLLGHPTLTSAYVVSQYYDTGNGSSVSYSTIKTYVPGARTTHPSISSEYVYQPQDLTTPISLQIENDTVSLTAGRPYHFDVEVMYNDGNSAKSFSFKLLIWSDIVEKTAWSTTYALHARVFISAA